MMNAPNKNANTVTPESPEEVLERLMREGQEDETLYSGESEADVLARTLAERDAARDAAEDSDMESGDDVMSALPSLLPVEYSVMRGLGKEGPHKVHIPVWQPIVIGNDKETNEPVYKRDEDGEIEFRLKVHKKRIGPFKLGLQMEASECLAAIHKDTLRAAMAWSFKRGEGDLNATEVVETLEKIFAKKSQNPVTGEWEEREAFTAESVTAMFHGTMADLTQDNIEAMSDFVALAMNRFCPEIDGAWVDENTDYGMLVRIIGKILWLNGGFRDRFLP